MNEKQTNQDLKEFTDAEGLVSIPTSDSHHPTVCMQFKKYKCLPSHPAWQSEDDHDAAMALAMASDGNTQVGLSTITLPLETPLRSAANNNSNYTNNNNQSNNYSSNNNINNNNNASADLASVDSSDTYASCQTHLFPSAGDLTAEFAGISCDLDDLNMESFASNPFEPGNNNGGEARPHVKRSASGDAMLHSLAVTPMLNRGQSSFQSLDSAAATNQPMSLDVDSSLPKHRKARFQAGSLNKLKCRMPGGSTPPKKASHDSLTDQPTATLGATTTTAAAPQPGTSSASATLPTTKKNRRASFMPSKSLASATKLINQHLFGIQNNVSKSKGTLISCTLF